MPTLSYFKLTSALLIFFVALLAGIYPFIRRFRSHQAGTFPIGESLAAGIFLGAGLIHMLGGAAQAFAIRGVTYPLPSLLAGIVFLVLLFFEHIGQEIYTPNSGTTGGFAILSVIMLSIHSFLMGAALGLSHSISLALLVLLAIMAHKWATSFALAVQVNQSALAVRTGIVLFAIFVLMTPLGILSGVLVSQYLKSFPLAAPIFSALAAGTFLYLGTLHGLQQSVMVEKCCNLRHFYFVIAGFVLMAVLAVWA